MRLLLPLFLGMLLITSCGDDSLPQCIDDKLASFRTEACATDGDVLGGNLVTYTFRTETVYCFNWGACQSDKAVEIWQADCTILCLLGGPDENQICDGTSWPEFAREDEEIFQN